MYENFKIGHKTEGRPFTHKRSPDVTVTTDVQVLGPFNIEQLQELKFYFTNNGSQDVSYKVYGSATGVQSGDRDGDGVEIPAAQITREWNEIATGTMTANDKEEIDIGSIGTYNYVKFEVNTSSGTTVINYYSMHKGTN